MFSQPSSGSAEGSTRSWYSCRHPCRASHRRADGARSRAASDLLHPAGRTHSRDRRLIFSLGRGGAVHGPTGSRWTIVLASALPLRLYACSAAPFSWTRRAHALSKRPASTRLGHRIGQLMSPHRTSDAYSRDRDVTSPMVTPLTSGVPRLAAMRRRSLAIAECAAEERALAPKTRCAMEEAVRRVAAASPRSPSPPAAQHPVARARPSRRGHDGRHAREPRRRIDACPSTRLAIAIAALCGAGVRSRCGFGRTTSRLKFRVRASSAAAFWGAGHPPRPSLCAARARSLWGAHVTAGRGDRERRGRIGQGVALIASCDHGHAHDPTDVWVQSGFEGVDTACGCEARLVESCFVRPGSARGQATASVICLCSTLDRRRLARRLLSESADKFGMLRRYPHEMTSGTPAGPVV